MPRERFQMSLVPTLTRCEAEGITIHTDPHLRERSGILVAFSERGGGESEAPYGSLNLAGHVSDDPGRVDRNRSVLLNALGIGRLARAVVTAQQTHGEAIKVVSAGDAGRGALPASGPPPIESTDALLTMEPEIPLLLLYADCVPVILVSEGHSPAISVVHAGWRGALASLPGKAADAMCREARCDASGIHAYIGPHIGSCCYEVEPGLLSQFVGEFGTIAAVGGHLDLGAVVLSSLMSAGVRPEHVARVNECTMDHVDRFFSYRASGITGRHGAVAVITKVG